MTRTWTLLGLALFAGSAHADLSAARQLMEPALFDLASQSQLTLQLVGNERDGAQNTTFSVLTSFRIAMAGNRRLPQIEVLDFRNGQLRNRLTGDGVTFWNFNTARNEFGSAVYGTFDGAQAADAQPKMFRLLQQRSSGPVAFSTRIYSDAFLGGSSTGWTPWFPVGQTSTTSDRITNERVTPNSTETVTYDLAPQPDGRVYLTGVTYDARRWLGDRWLTTKYTVTVWRGYVPQDANFGFVPPRGARPVSSSTAGG